MEKQGSNHLECDLGKSSVFSIIILSILFGRPKRCVSLPFNSMQNASKCWNPRNSLCGENSATKSPPLLRCPLNTIIKRVLLTETDFIPWSLSKWDDFIPTALLRTKVSHSLKEGIWPNLHTAGENLLKNHVCCVFLKNQNNCRMLESLLNESSALSPGRKTVSIIRRNSYQ